jgi:uncharacterized protein
MIRAVLDANVIVSAVLTTARIPAQVLDAWRTDRFALLVSSAILEEVARVLEYPRIGCITGRGPRPENSWPNSAPLRS